MNPVAARWREFWFPAVPVRRIALFRLVITAFALVDIAVVSAYMTRYARVDDAFHRPILLFRVLQVPRLGPEATTVLRAVLVVALALALVGFATRAALWTSAVLYTYWFGTFYSFHAVEHGRIPIVIALITLAIAPAGKAYSIDGRLRDRPARADEPRDVLAGWALRVMMVLVVCAYTFAAYSKLRAQGIGWTSSGALNDVLIENQEPLGLWVARHPGLVQSMAALTLVTEALAPVVFFRGRIRDAYLAAMVTFHIGTLVLLDISFLGLVLCYSAFYDLEVGADRLVGWWRRQGRLVPLRTPLPAQEAADVGEMT